MPTETGAIHLPNVDRLVIRHMTLYREMPLVDVEFGNGVFCLSGANGLGKSTFLAILNYALTGIVADPDQKFASLKEYFRHSLSFSRDYFTGRVSELDRDTAEVTIEVSVNGAHYVVTRGMFSPTSLRALTIAGADGSEFDGTAEDEEDARTLHDRFAESIVERSGLATFEQLVFLQHFLLTFDERRHLLFWDPEVARQALYLVFGVDGTLASQADEWLRRSDRLESQARNAQYQATTAAQKIKELRGRVASAAPEDDGLIELYQEIVAVCDTSANQVQAKLRASDDARQAYTSAAARLHAMNADYDRLFSSQFVPGVDPHDHPIIQSLLDDGKCSICGNKGSSLADHARTCLDERKCPLCLSPIEDHSRRSNEAFEQLEELDTKITEVREGLRSAEETLQRTLSEVDEAKAENDRALASRAEFERLHGDITLATDDHGPSAVTALIGQLEAERAAAVQRRNEFRRKRDEFRAMLEPVQRDLATRYLDAERTFLPRFQHLAHEFLGLDLQVRMEQRARGPELALTINGTARRMTTQLSESQRYFVDIALRMALAEHLSGDDGSACLLIDTPEGSLDIAYESRAGRMFGKFVRGDNRLIMTANINSSRLVQELARVCGPTLMRVERMTAWTTLSEVQAESETLFDEAFDEIERALASGGQS